MPLQDYINNTSDELSHITCTLFFFRVDYALTVLAFGMKIFSLKTKAGGKLYI